MIFILVLVYLQFQARFLIFILLFFSLPLRAVHMGQISAASDGSIEAVQRSTHVFGSWFDRSLLLLKGHDRKRSGALSPSLRTLTGVF